MDACLPGTGAKTTEVHLTAAGLAKMTTSYRPHGRGTSGMVWGMNLRHGVGSLRSQSGEHQSYPVGLSMDHLPSSPLLGTREEGWPGLGTATWSVKRYACLLWEQSKEKKEMCLDKLDVKSSSQ